MATLPASPETISNPWISSAADSPARISAKPGSESASRELAAAFGLSTPVWFGNFDLDTCSLRTSQGSLFQTQCEELSENWPDSGMWDAGAVYELQSSEPVTCGSACSLWPTAQRHDAQGGKTPEQIESMRERTGAGVFNLNEAAEHWATPNAHDGRRPGSDATSTQGANLKRDAEIWQTPSTDSFRSRGGDRKDEMGLDQEARNWKTPHGMSNVDFRGKVGGCGGGEFAKQANNWVTPNARDWKSETGSENNRYDRTPGLSRQVYNLSHPDPPIPDGPASSENVPTSRRLWPTARQEPGTHSIVNGKRYETSLEYVARDQKDQTRRLNPRFVEWLMGFPISWTEL